MGASICFFNIDLKDYRFQEFTHPSCFLLGMLIERLSVSRVYNTHFNVVLKHFLFPGIPNTLLYLYVVLNNFSQSL